ncbi:Transcriptional regulator, AbiEi antitoxin, Type IV TA system [Austwickia chelonae]|nr:hypothetical protein [Austwickia chelonae]SEW37765.1 Transcriptional regulator, AbiEi antitoxin, Type IV TA system [Austwickia chelonae]
MFDALLTLLTHRGDRSRAQLLGQGFTEATLTAALRRGDIIRIGRATYGIPRPDLTPEQRHARLAQAVLHRSAGTAVLSHHSALAVVGLPLHGVPFGVAHLTATRSSHYRRRSDHVRHAADFSSRDTGFGTKEQVSVGAALVQTGLRWGAQALLPSADAALRRGLVTEDDLHEAVAGYTHSPGMAEVRMAVASMDPLAESVGESLLRWQLNLLGYRTISQVDAGFPGRGYRIDLVVEDTRLALEFDGVSKYGLDDAVTTPHERAARLRAEKSRDEDLLSCGWYVVHVTWPELFRPQVIADRVAAGLSWCARAV